jgi:hypothetical protein
LSKLKVPGGFRSQLWLYSASVQLLKNHYYLLMRYKPHLVHNKDLPLGSNASAIMPANAGRSDTIMKKTSHLGTTQGSERARGVLTTKIGLLQSGIANKKKPKNRDSLLRDRSFRQSL